jgi:methylisocitrate lyase
MNKNISQGKKLKQAISENTPLQIVGTVNAYSSLLAQKKGHKAIYLSGGGVAASSMGLPDLGITTLQDVLIDVERITRVCELPLLVDADTGWGGAFNISRMVKSMITSGAAGIHMEDQVEQKRCGHRPNKELVSSEEMQNRIKAAADAKTDSDFMIMARTDAIANEGLDSALRRAASYVEAGANAIFAEAVLEIEDYKKFAENLNVPILANITEFGKTPLFSKEELKEADVDMILYPLSAFRAMSKAAEGIYSEILEKGTQQDLIDKMQTRDELYEVLDYHTFEKKLDDLFEE